MNNNLGLFTNKAIYYARYRPVYAKEFIDEMLKRGIIGVSKTVADIGAGTGILTKQLSDTGSNVIAIEPNEGMLLQLQQALKETSATIIQGTAECIPLQNSSVDAVFVGQAFHWFDPAAFKKECKRILKYDSPVILVWNKKKIVKWRLLEKQ